MLSCLVEAGKSPVDRNCGSGHKLRGSTCKKHGGSAEIGGGAPSSSGCAMQDPHLKVGHLIHLCFGQSIWIFMGGGLCVTAFLRQNSR